MQSSVPAEPRAGMRRGTSKQHFLAIVGLCLVAIGGTHSTAAVGDSSHPSYAEHVAPILQAYCAGCHNPDDLEGKLDLTSFAALQEGGENGAVLVAGKSGESRIIQVLTGEAEPAMPPEGNDPPTAQEIALLRAWIDAGAAGPAADEPVPAAPIPHIEPLVEPRRDIGALAFSPGGDVLAVGRYGAVELINVTTREVVRTLNGHEGQVNAVKFFADGNRLAAGAGIPSARGQVKIWNVADGTEVQTLSGHRDAIYALDVSADGKVLATGSYDQEIKLWDLDAGKEMRTLSGHSGPVFALEFHPAGRGLLASASGDRTAKLWDVATGERLETFGQPLKELYALTWAPDGARVAAGGVDNRIRLWGVSESAREGTNPLLMTRFAHEGAILALAFSADGKSLVSAAEDRTVRVWDNDPLRERFSIKGQSDWPVAVAMPDDGDLFAVGRLDGTFTLYRLSDGQIVRPNPLLAAISVRGIQRGVTTAVEIKGRNLEYVDGIRLGDERLAVQIVEQATDRLLVNLTPSNDVPRGRYDVWLTSGEQASGKLPLEVDDIPQLAESEPNDGRMVGSNIPLPVAVWGTLDRPGDRDRFSFSAKAGQTIVCDAAAESIGSQANLILTLRDSAERVVQSSNDFQGQADPLVGFVVPQDGDYTVEAQDLQAAGSNEHHYRLSIGEFAFVTGYAPLGAKAGQETAVHLAGWNLPENAAIRVHANDVGRTTATLPGEFRWRKLPVLEVSQDERVAEQEPNGAISDATLVTALPIVVDGVISSPGDVDLYRVTAQQGETWIMEIVAAEFGSPLDSKIEVLDSKGNPVTRLLLQAIRDSQTTFRPSTSDQTGFRVTNWEEMHLDQYLYLDGDVAKIFRQPRGPDSDTLFYDLRGRRRGYFDCTPTAHALDELIYVVEPRTLDEKLEENGLPVFPVYFENDDDVYRKKGADSRLTFTAPRDGEYLVRVADVRDFGGLGYAYQLAIRRPAPDFAVNFTAHEIAVNRGSGRQFTISVERIDEFDDDIRVDIDGLPAGFVVSTPLVIQAGHQSATGVLYVREDAPEPTADDWNQMRVNAAAVVAGEEVVKDVPWFRSVRIEDPPKVRVFLEPEQLTIVPGQTITARLSVERNGFDDRLGFDVSNLPQGVIVDNIGLNGVLIPPGETERTIFLTAEHWVPETSRSFQATAEADGGQTSLPVTLHVRHAEPVARATK